MPKVSQESRRSIRMSPRSSSFFWESLTATSSKCKRIQHEARSQNRAVTGIANKPPLSPVFLSKRLIGIHRSDTSAVNKNASKKDTPARHKRPRCCTRVDPTLQVIVKIKVPTRADKGSLAHLAKCLSPTSTLMCSSWKNCGICKMSNGAVAATATLAKLESPSCL